MAREFLTGDRDQPFLLPPDMRDWLPADHLVWFVIEVADTLDLGAFDRPLEDPLARGRRRYDPKLLVTLLLYAYAVGQRSSRQIERRCREDVAFRVAATNLAPDHTTISRFLKDYAAAFDTLFVQLLSVAAAMGMGRVGSVFLDGTKMAADASPLSARTRAWIVEEVARITEEARRVNDEEDRRYGDARGDELPEDLADPVSRRARLEEALASIDEQDAADAGRPPSRKRTKPAKGNVTDPECRVMKGPRGYFPAYNAQAAASEDGLIVGADVTNEATDNHQFEPMVDQTCENLEAAGMDSPHNAVADNGYYTNDNATPSEDPQVPEPIIAPPTDKRRKPINTRGPIPKTATVAQRMERKLATNTGAAVYKKRGATIEPVFGITKTARGIDRFRRRGLQAARHEWRLIASTHNILKMWRAAAVTP